MAWRTSPATQAALPTEMRPGVAEPTGTAAAEVKEAQFHAALLLDFPWGTAGGIGTVAVAALEVPPVRAR